MLYSRNTIHQGIVFISLAKVLTYRRVSSLNTLRVLTEMFPKYHLLKIVRYQTSGQSHNVL